MKDELHKVSGVNALLSLLTSALGSKKAGALPGEAQPPGDGAFGKLLQSGESLENLADNGTNAVEARSPGQGRITIPFLEGEPAIAADADISSDTKNPLAGEKPTEKSAKLAPLPEGAAIDEVHVTQGKLAPPLAGHVRNVPANGIEATADTTIAKNPGTGESSDADTVSEPRTAVPQTGETHAGRTDVLGHSESPKAVKTTPDATADNFLPATAENPTGEADIAFDDAVTADVRESRQSVESGQEADKEIITGPETEAKPAEQNVPSPDQNAAMPHGLPLVQPLPREDNRAPATGGDGETNDAEAAKRSERGAITTGRPSEVENDIGKSRELALNNAGDPPGRSTQHTSEHTAPGGSDSFAAELDNTSANTGVPERVRAHPAHVAQDLSISIARRVSAGDENFSITLNPEHLGEVRIELNFGDDKRLSGHMVADHRVAAELLRGHASEINRTLADMGFNMSGEGFRFQHGGQQQGGQPGGEQGTNSHRPASEAGMDDQLEQAVQTSVSLGGNQLNLIA